MLHQQKKKQRNKKSRIPRVKAANVLVRAQEQARLELAYYQAANDSDGDDDDGAMDDEEEAEKEEESLRRKEKAEKNRAHFRFFVPQPSI